MLTRMFAYFTFFCYLMMGTFIVRIVAPETVSFKLDKNYFTVTTTEFAIKTNELTQIQETSDLSFSPINSVRPIEKKPVYVAVKNVPKLKAVSTNTKRYLPFYEPVSLSPVYFQNHISENLVSNYVDFNYLEKSALVAEVPHQDEISTKQAAISIEEEPVFFEYAKEEEVKIVETSPTAIQPEVINTVVEEAPVQIAVSEVPGSNEVAINDLDDVSSFVAFDYKKAQADIKNDVAPKVSSHNNKIQRPVVPQNEDGLTHKSMDGLAQDSTSEYPVSLRIVANGFDLKKVYDLENYELRFQDDLAEIREDFGSGEIQFDTMTTQSRSTRTATLIKRGFAPTTTDLILIEGADTAEVPLMDQEVLNNLNSKYEKSGPVGAVLVRLDDSTEVAKLDVPFGHVLTLDANLKITKNDDYVYQLFVGTQAGNALLTYEKMSGEKVHKIIHIHENEVSFERNIFEEIKHKRVKLFEQNLLSKEAIPLVIGEEQVRSFVNQKNANKKNSNTYEINEVFTNFGGRQYLELNHADETVFVGYKENEKLVIPSENFMRFILSNMDSSSMVNRCVVQLNLKKHTSKYEVAPESLDSAIMIQAQVLDADGVFYSSMSEKSEKLIIVGEIQNKSNMSADGRINIKLEYENGSTEYVSSYCSPNTYLVEQL